MIVTINFLIHTCQEDQCCKHRRGGQILENGKVVIDVIGDEKSTKNTTPINRESKAKAIRLPPILTDCDLWEMQCRN